MGCGKPARGVIASRDARFSRPRGGNLPLTPGMPWRPRGGRIGRVLADAAPDRVRASRPPRKAFLVVDNNESPTPPEHVIRRRTIVQGVAWSIPVIATAVAVPAATASAGCTPGNVAVLSGGRTLARQTVTIPSGAKNIMFTVCGGAGGGPQTGGAGAYITGTLAVGLGGPLVVELVAGGQGHHRDEPAEAATGYGNGGTSLTSGDVFNGTGGGAGSAILMGGAPLIVAGGGGGAGSYRHSNVTVAFSGVGGSAGNSGAPYIHGTGNTYAGGGLGAVGSTPGAGGTATYPADGHGGGNFSGSPGTAGGSGTGGNGGSSPVTGGGGGGGYAGGGSGAHTEWYTPDNQLRAHAAGGGAGSNYIAASSVITSAAVHTSGVPDNTSDDRSGLVTLTWTC